MLLIIGVMKQSVKAVTNDWNAPPMITPIARLITLPLRANSLNSSKNFFICVLSTEYSTDHNNLIL